jgi:LEA14-like dessication related protein
MVASTHSKCLKAVSVVVFACATPPPPTPGAIPIQAEGQDLEVVAQTLTDFKASESVKVVNPTDQPVKLTDAEYELVLEEKVVDQGQLNIGKEVPAKGEVTFEIAGKATYAKDGDEIKALGEKKALDIALRGDVAVVGPGIPPDTFREFAKAAAVRTPSMPQPRMHTVQATREDTQVDVIFLVEIYNPNPFELHIKGLKTKVALNEHPVGETENGADTVPAGGTSQYSVPLTVTQQAYGKDLIVLARQNRVKYHMTGELDLGIVKVPVDLSGGVPFGM